MGWMAAAGQQLRELLSLPRPSRVMLDQPAAVEFDSVPKPIDRLFAEMAGAVPSRVGRAEALSVAAVQRGRNALCSIATLPLTLYKGLEIARSSFLEQIDPDVPNVVTLAQTIEDLAFEGISWWRITAQDFAGFPLAARHLDVGSVSLDPPKGTPNPFPSGVDPRGVPIVWVDGKPVPATELIRFDSPNPGLLKANARAIRRALLLDKLASTYADNPRPTDYFTDGDDPDVDPMEDEEIDSFLAEWKASRKASGTGWIPRSVKRVDVNAPSPQELQLVELQRQVTLEIANGLGVDPEDLGVSTTSRTYFNAADRRMSKINETYAPYMSAITQRLSMGDVTRRGYRVAFDLTDYLKPDPAGQVAYWKALKDMGVMDADEIRAAAGLSGPAPKPKPAAAPPAPPAEGDGDDQADDQTSGAEAARRPAGMTFADEQGPAMTFAGGDFAGGTEPAKVDVERRTITGLAVPYNRVARKYGMAFRFRPGSLQYGDVSRIKHLKDHYTPVGVTASVEDTKRGPIVKLQVLDGPEGSPAKLERDQLLYDAQHGLYDGLSIGVDFSLDPENGDVEWNDKDKVYDVLRADWRETSSTPMPAFDDARVTKVAASRTAQRGRSGMPDEQESTETQTTPPATGGDQQTAGDEQLQFSAEQRRRLLENDGVVEQLFSQLLQPQQRQDQQQPARVDLTAEQMSVLMSRPGGAQIVGALLGVPMPAAEPEQREERRTVDPTRRTASTQLSEPASYRFDDRGELHPAAHDFGADIIAAAKTGRADSPEYRRVMEFVQQQFRGAQFNVASGDVDDLNPAITLPRYIDQKEFAYPIWQAVNRGAPPNGIQPFRWPKFNSAAGPSAAPRMVAAHTEGTEPQTGSYTTTVQSVDPEPISGKATINREVWDMGGSPGIGNLIWTRMVRDWFETLETLVAAELDAATPTSLGAFTAGGIDDVLVAEMVNHLALLQYARGGFRFDTAFCEAGIYTRMAGAVDASGRHLLPPVAPQNAVGTANDRWSGLMVGGVPFYPAWALGATVGTAADSSYLIDRTAVDGWATAPMRLEFTQAAVATIDLALWGYAATAINDIAGVREISYDPAA